MKFDGKDVKVVWLDLDDTIIDFLTNSRRALEKLRQQEPLLLRLFPDNDSWIELYERHNQALWVTYSRGDITRAHLRLERFRLPLADGGASADEALEAARRYDTVYLDLLAEETALIPNSIELMQFLRDQGLKIGCLSNGFTEVQYRKIRNCGLESWFDTVVLSDDIGFTKPDVRLFKHAMERAECDAPEAHLMIGDNAATDIEGALGAGWNAIQFLRTPSSAVHPGCPHRKDSLEAIIGLLRQSLLSDSSCNC